MIDPTQHEETAELRRLVDEIRRAGVRRVHVLAWRDLDDPDAGGSEVHADHFMRRWAEAGLDVLHRTSAGIGIPATARRNGYDVVRRGSRYSVFPRTVVAELDAPDGTLRRPRRDLERRAVVLAGVVSPATHHDRPPRARPDVGPDPARPVGRPRPCPRDTHRTALLPPDRGGDAQYLDARRAADDRVRTGARDCRRQRRRAVLHTRRTPV